MRFPVLSSLRAPLRASMFRFSSRRSASRPSVFLSERARSSRREIVACLTLNAFLVSGWLLPFTSSLRVAQAREVVAVPLSLTSITRGVASKGADKGAAIRGRKASSSAPAWYRAARKREAHIAQTQEEVQEEIRRASHRGGFRLAQLGKGVGGGPDVSTPGQVVEVTQEASLNADQVSGFRLLRESFPEALKSSRKLYVPNPYTSQMKVDLSKGRVPTQKEVSGLGASCGALAPAAAAEPAKFQQKADTGLRGQGYENGLGTNLPPSEELVQDPPRYQIAKHLEEVRDRVRSARRQNREMASAMMAWDTANWGSAKLEFQAFAKAYPKSPWLPEALIHLADLNKSSAQPNEAEDGYRKVMAMTSDKAGEMSFEAHQKAYERWADLYLREGRYGQARPMLEDIVAHDLHWRRVTWAYSWLMQLNAYKSDGKAMLAQLDCGSKALATLLVDTGHAHAGREVAALKPSNTRGFSLADLQTMAGRRGVQLVGFHAPAAQMIGAPLPLILHYKARQGAPTTARRTKVAKAPVRSFDEYAHFVVVRGYNAESHLWNVFNPQDGTRAFLTSAQLDEESSGAGLMTVNAAPVQLPQKAVWLAKWPKGVAASAANASSSGAIQTVSLPRLSHAQMENIVGTCYAVRAPGGLGCQSSNISVRGSCGGGSCTASAHGEPKVSVNSISQNIFIIDTPVWYEPAKGPSVEVSVSYNSQDASNYDSPTGNKWTFGFTSHVAEMPNQISVFMPGGAQNVYTIPASAITTTTVTTTDPSTGAVAAVPVTKVADRFVAISPRGVLSTLVKTAPGTFSLRFQDGSQWNYGAPLGTGTVPALLSQTDRWGQSLTLQYGVAGGKIVPFTLTDADGKVTRFQYDLGGHLIYAQTPDERQASFSYDGNGNLVQCVDAAGQAFQYAYDGAVNVTQLNTAQGAWNFAITSTQVPPSFNTTITDPTQSNPVHFAFYDASHGVPAYYFTDHAGNKTTLSAVTLSGGDGENGPGVNPDSEIGSTQSPSGVTQSYGYNNLNLVDPTTVYNGRNTTILTYNAQGRVVTTLTNGQDPNEAGDGGTRTSQATYAPNGLDVVSANVSGSTTTTPIQTQSQVVLQNATYNSMHQPLAVVDAAGHETDYSYMPWGAVQSVTTYESAVTHVTQYAYGQVAGTNEKDRVVAVIQDGTTQATYTYDASGRVRTSTDATGLTTTYRYNNLDAPLGVYYPDGTSELTDYTCCALPGMVTDRSGRRSYSDYDQLKRLVRVQDADGQTLQFDYNADGDRVSMLDANGQRTRWAYDAAHRPTAKTYVDGTSESWDYVQSANLLAGATNARGARTSFAYSRFDELAGIGYPNTATTSNVSFTYDLLGRKASMTDGVGTSGWSYDGVGRVQGESGPFGNDSLSYSYDSLNRVQSLSIGRDATTSDNESFGYDGLGRLASVSASAGAFGSVGTFGYSYVGNTSLLAQMTRPNGTKTVLSYENAGTSNALHRLTGVQDVSATGDNIASFGYGYDSSTANNGFVDNRTSQTRSYGSEGAQTISYGYNPTSMLQGEGGSQGGASTPALSKSYVFDAMGNRTSMSDGVAKTQVTSTYNALNQLTGQSSYSTSTGAAVGTGSSAFGYDGDGNMSLVTAKDASGTVTGQTSYTYDDASRLIGITTPGSSKWQFVYDGLSRLRISRSWKWTNGAWVQDSEKRRVYLCMDVVQERDVNNNVTASYTRTGNVGGLLARSTSTGSVFYGYDGSGNVTTLTDGTGAVVGSYTYDAWGNILNPLGTKAQENPYRFSTKEQLAGYCFYGCRFYSSGIGRWINRDPLKENGSVNFYSYLISNPLNLAESYGLVAFDIQAAIVGFLVGAVASLAGQLALAAYDTWKYHIPWECWDFKQMFINAAISGLAGAVQSWLLVNGVTDTRLGAAIVGGVVGGIQSIVGQIASGGVSSISPKQVGIDVGIGFASGLITGPIKLPGFKLGGGAGVNNQLGGQAVQAIVNRVGLTTGAVGAAASADGGLPMLPCCGSSSSSSGGSGSQVERSTR